jgi:hypothetical protein
MRFSFAYGKSEPRAPVSISQMTSRFERLSIQAGMIIATAAIILIATPADASASNKTPQIFEIKSFPKVEIPEIPTVQLIADLMNTSEKVEIAETSNQTSQITMVPSPSTAPAAPVNTVARKGGTVLGAYQPNDGLVPAKKVGAERVYMHEPEIRAYVCPKLGDKCNTFIAILKAENGSHECTRDNRGTNRNGSIDIGLTQINWTPASPYSFAQLQDCKFNLDLAMKKYETRGFQPWAAYNSGRYLKHMPAVLASAAALEAAAIQPEQVATVTVN